MPKFSKSIGRSGSDLRTGMIVAVAGIVLASEQPTLAYIDPGTGSLIYQAILASLIGLGFAFRRTSDTLRSFTQNWFGKRDARSEKSQPDQS